MKNFIFSLLHLIFIRFLEIISVPVFFIGVIYMGPTLESLADISEKGPSGLDILNMIIGICIIFFIFLPIFFYLSVTPKSFAYSERHPRITS